MHTLKKSPDRDFVILNLTDPQLANDEWEEGHISEKLLHYTARELISRVKPDLITVSGDLAWASQTESYENLADYLDSFGIPWAPVFGNHDNQKGPERVNEIADILLSRSNCLFEKGPSNIGCGNYVIAIEEDGKPVSAVIMMDSHDCRLPTPEEGDVNEIWDELLPEQFPWYREQAEKLKAAGYRDSAMIMHIPLYTYREAYKAAFKEGVDPESMKPWESEGAPCWNEGYEDSFGVNYEEICSHPTDNGFFDLVLEIDFTKHIICGHDHINNTSINYRGVRLTYGTKIGCGCSFDPTMNGGTVLTVGSSGIRDVRHEYVDVADMWNEFERSRRNNG